MDLADYPHLAAVLSQKTAAPGMRDTASKLLRGFDLRRGAMIGAGLGAAKGLLTDPGTNPDGTPRSRLGAAAKGALGGAAVGGAAGYLNQKFVRPGLMASRAGSAARAESLRSTGQRLVTGAKPPAAAVAAAPGPLVNKNAVEDALEHTPEIVHTAELDVSAAKFAQMVTDLNAGRAPEGAKPVIHEIIKRAQAAGIEPTAELVAVNLIKYAARKLQAAERKLDDDLHHELPGDLDAKAPKSAKADFKAPKMTGKACKA